MRDLPCTPPPEREREGGGMEKKKEKEKESGGERKRERERNREKERDPERERPLVKSGCVRRPCVRGIFQNRPAQPRNPKPETRPPPLSYLQ